MAWLWTLVAAAGLPSGPEIRVAKEGWGDAGADDIARVLRSTAEALAPLLGDRRFPPIEVSRSRTGPITLFERGPAGEIRVRLDVEGTYWAQFAFQFAHELGHIALGFAEYPNPNLWFEETLCEASSLFALGRMAEAWKTQPPYPNWKSFAPALRKYRDDRLGKAKLPEGASLAEWFREREGSLRKNALQRELNAVMAGALLPLLEESPERWAAFTGLNAVRGDETRSFPRYLRDASASVEERHRAFVRTLAGRFGVSLDP